MLADFLTRFLRNAEFQKMSENQALIVLLSSPKGIAEYQYNTGAEMAVPQRGKDIKLVRDRTIPSQSVCWITENQFTNRKPSSCIPRIYGNRRELAADLNQPICHCGNIHFSEKVLTKYIEALHPTIFSVAGWYKKSKCRAICLNVVDIARHEEDAVRARTLIPEEAVSINLCKNCNLLRYYSTRLTIEKV